MAVAEDDDYQDNCYKGTRPPKEAELECPEGRGDPEVSVEVHEGRGADNGLAQTKGYELAREIEIHQKCGMYVGAKGLGDDTVGHQACEVGQVEADEVRHVGVGDVRWKAAKHFQGDDVGDEADDHDGKGDAVDDLGERRVRSFSDQATIRDVDPQLSAVGSLDHPQATTGQEFVDVRVIENVTIRQDVVGVRSGVCACVNADVIVEPGQVVVAVTAVVVRVTVFFRTKTGLWVAAIAQMPNVTGSYGLRRLQAFR